MQPSQAQTQQETPDAIYNATAAESREKVSGKTVPKHRGTSRVFQFASPYRNPGKYLNPLTKHNVTQQFNFLSIYFARITLSTKVPKILNINA